MFFSNQYCKLITVEEAIGYCRGLRVNHFGFLLLTATCLLVVIYISQCTCKINNTDLLPTCCSVSSQ